MKNLNDLDWWKHLATNVGGVLTSVLGFFSILNLHYDWFNVGSINAFVAIIVALGTLFVGSFATFVNTYLTNHSKVKAAEVVAKYDADQKAAAAEKLAEAKKIVELAAQAEADKLAKPAPVQPVSAVNNVPQK
jgi:hypothetical protein